MASIPKLNGGVSLADLYLIRNDGARTCRTCGEVHDYISTKGKDQDGPCDGPAVFTADSGLGGLTPGSWGVRVPLTPADLHVL